MADCVVSHGIESLHVATLRDVPEGEELVISYLDGELPLGDRQEALRALYGFDCRCECTARER